MRKNTHPKPSMSVQCAYVRAICWCSCFFFQHLINIIQSQTNVNTLDEIAQHRDDHLVHTSEHTRTFKTTHITMYRNLYENV